MIKYLLVWPWASGKALRVKVLFDGKTLADEDITVGDGATEKATSVTTDAAGIATVPLAEGRWYVLSVGHTVKSRVPAIADIDAYVATLSFRM